MFTTRWQNGPVSRDNPHSEEPPAGGLTELPPATVRLFPITAVGTLLWAIGLAVISLMDLPDIAFDVALAGLALGLVGCAVTARMDRRLKGGVPTA